MPPKTTFGMAARRKSTAANNTLRNAGVGAIVQELAFKSVFEVDAIFAAATRKFESRDRLAVKRHGSADSVGAGNKSAARMRVRRDGVSGSWFVPGRLCSLSRTPLAVDHVVVLCVADVCASATLLSRNLIAVFFSRIGGDRLGRDKHGSSFHPCLAHQCDPANPSGKAH